MRVVHTSDWHLGRQTYGVSRRPDLEAALEEVFDIARDFSPHLILHSGDLFETSRPAVEDMKMAQEILQRMSALAPVVVIAGNHDSVALFELFQALVGDDSRLRFIGTARSPGQGGVLDYPGEGREVARLAALPFVHANRVVDALEHGPEVRTMTYADRIQRIQMAYGQALERGYHPERHVLLFSAHLYVDGALWSRSERPLHVCETYATRVTQIPHVSYAAFGHIHRPQALPGQVPGRYAGSPVGLDFGEEGEIKQVVRVEALPGRAARIEPVELRSGRKLLSLRGTMQQLEARALDVRDELLRVTIETDEPTPGLADWAKRLFPRATVLEVSERCAASRVTLVEASTEEIEHFETLADAFEAYLGENAPEDQDLLRVRDLFQGLLVESQSQDERLPAEVEALERALGEGVAA